jgi:hypothetical protein
MGMSYAAEVVGEELQQRRSPRKPTRLKRKTNRRISPQKKEKHKSA